MRNILVLGATSSIAQACIRQWINQDQMIQLHLVARNQEKIARVCDDLKVRYPSLSIAYYLVDLSDNDQIFDQMQQILNHYTIDLCLIAQGIMYLDEGSLSAEEIQRLIQTNSVSIATSTDLVYQRMHQQGHGQIGVIGSVAGDRGRRTNYLYGASKAFVDTYIQGLQHRAALENSGVRLSLIKPGPTQSEMTAHLISQGKKLPHADEVASIIVRGLAQNKRIIYAPKIWRIIMLVICHIPFFIFKKLDI